MTNLYKYSTIHFNMKTYAVLIFHKFILIMHMGYNGQLLVPYAF